MGIARAAYRLLLEEKKRGVLKGESILQLGRQCVLFGDATLRKYSEIHQVPLANIQSNSSFSPHYKDWGYIDDLTLFKSLGFKNVKSLDIYSGEGADLIFDLNEPIPKEYWGLFDVIYDGGTLEHVFNFPQALKNVHLLLKEGGVVMHVSPSHNHVDHGYYMFSPQVFSEYYVTNRYNILTSKIFEYAPDYNHPWQFYEYRPGTLQNLAYGGFDHSMLAIYLAAQKMPESTAGVAPQQGRCSFPIMEEKKEVAKKENFFHKKLKNWEKRLPVRWKNYLAKKQLKKSYTF